MFTCWCSFRLLDRTAQNYQQCSFRFLSLHVWVMIWCRLMTPRTPNTRWFRGFPSSDLSELELLWTDGYSLNGLRAQTNTSDNSNLETWTHLTEGGQSDQWTCSPQGQANPRRYPVAFRHPLCSAELYNVLTESSLIWFTFLALNQSALGTFYSN